MMKMLSRDLQNNGDQFCGGLQKDGAEGGCSSVKRRAYELLSNIKGEIQEGEKNYESPSFPPIPHKWKHPFN